MSTKLKVVFSLDPTGFDKDITEEILISSTTCLFCCHDKRHGINRLYNEIVDALEQKGYDFELHYFFSLLKVYVV